ncbi:hypothetical protein [Hufsiella ginkgonis]|uniref:Uncharacterized protein n=1 Tax=Hufsiella ginkgonis TaxID=2695274 RepID=A0A7K1XTD0_9SPHI|nr:hypothetical protein [Hufsiella ginkgonis]MXV14098.1 hypothetical protein [Hufsiella ginkgonis]
MNANDHLSEQELAGNAAQQATPPATGNETRPGSPDEVLMDYQDLAESEGDAPRGKPPVPAIGLNGGQAPDDPDGIDISKYTGPESDESTRLSDPDAAYGTGPGNGLGEAE